MLKIKPNNEVTFVYKKYKNINDPNEVLIINEKKINIKNETLFRCLITMIQTIYKNSNYFSIESNNQFIKLNYLYNRSFTQKNVYLNNIFLTKNILLVREKEDKKEFKLIVERIQKINNLLC